MNKTQINQLCFLLLIVIFGSSCSTTKTLPKKIDIKTSIQNSSVFSKIFTGFVLHDPVQNIDLINIDGHKYYTPASNTKLLTLYTSLKVLKDSIPVLKYETKNDSLFFSGTANPMTLNPFFEDDNTSLTDFLSQQNKQLFYCPTNFNDERFGPGWAWDDNLYYYQTEKTSLPLYGSLMHIEDTIVYPSFFQDSVEFYSGKNQYERGFDNNQFKITNARKDFVRDMPFHQNESLTQSLLSQYLNKKIKSCPENYKFEQPKLLNQKITDSLYRFFMYESDNFIGEQLMLMNSFVLYDTMEVRRSIQWAQDNILQDAPDSLRWVDGSGLSRYNLFTPSSVVFVLNGLLDEMGLNGIKDIFPAGGRDGTIRGWYDAEVPYIYAKTGTLSNKHCLSGYIITKKNRLLIFSFMNNNYLGNLDEVKGEMQRILHEIYLHY